jgi:hypothetical protein
MKFEQLKMASIVASLQAYGLNDGAEALMKAAGINAAQVLQAKKTMAAVPSAMPHVPISNARQRLAQAAHAGGGAARPPMPLVGPQGQLAGGQNVNRASEAAQQFAASGFGARPLPEPMTATRAANAAERQVGRGYAGGMLQGQGTVTHQSPQVQSALQDPRVQALLRQHQLGG